MVLLLLARGVAHVGSTMNRNLTYFIGPEVVLTALSVGVYWFCARHNSGEGKDILLMEKLVMLLPFIVTPVVFATVFVPGGKSWWWLGRAIVLTFIMLFICGGRAIVGFGTGAKGQDAAFILIIMFGSIAIGLATAIAGTLILMETKPAFAEWFRARRLLGSILALVSSVPIGFALGVIVTLGVSFFALAYSAIKR
jgi:hypothetical protein